MSRQRGAIVAGGVVVVIGLIAAAAVFGPWGGSGSSEDDRDGARVAAEAFATAWQAGTLDQAPVTAGSGDVAAQTALLTAGLGTGLGSTEPLRPTVTITSVTRTDGVDGQATATAAVSWAIGGDGGWTYDTTLALVEEPEGWKVAWTPTAVAPGLVDGEVLVTARVTGPRGRILDTAGTPLVRSEGEVTVGIRKSRTDDPEGTARTVAGMVGVEAEDLVARVLAAGEDEFVEVTVMDAAAYAAIRDQLQPLPGTVFTRSEGEGDLPERFASAVLGTAGPASAEVAERSEGRVLEGEVTGLSGIQASQNEVLAGTPGLRVEAQSLDGGAARTLAEFPGTPGADVTVTLDSRLQLAADAALAGASGPAALVAIRVSNGDVLAVSNGPAGASGYNRAMLGRYAPGSTFKVVSALAMLEAGSTPDTVIDCPATLVVGKEFRNAGGFELGPVPFRTNFARSCNTAFVAQADTISSETLTATAERLGYRKFDIGAPLFGGSVPVAADRTEHAANLIGQGKVEASPLIVALASASVANGHALTPRIVVQPGADPAPGEALPAGPLEQLRSMMRSVVTDGTGEAVLDVPGGEVHAKSGTAEYGTETPPQTHAWFTGYQGDVAFAVLVEGGSSGGGVAAPIAAAFLAAIAS